MVERDALVGRRTVNGVAVRIKEVTEYPFGDQIQFVVEPSQAIEFELRIRKPNWAKQAQLSVEGAVVTEENGFYVVTKKWEKGDVLSYQLNPSVEVKTGNQDDQYVQRGALVYALPLPSVGEKIKDYPVGDFHDWYFKMPEGSNFDYSLVSNAEFEVVQNSMTQNPWVESPVTIQTALFNKQTNEVEPVALQPIGSTILRRLTFEKSKGL